MQRGKWILENLLGTPPPPPPADVPELKAAPHGKQLTMREQMEVHRANPACAGTTAAQTGRVYVSVDNSLLQAGTDIARTIRKVRRDYLQN